MGMTKCFAFSKLDNHLQHEPVTMFASFIVVKLGKFIIIYWYVIFSIDREI